MTNSKSLGIWGENIAKNYLIKNNYIFVIKNYKSSYREIDLIFKILNKYIFIEVKTRTHNEEAKFESPLGVKQTKNLQKAIIDYCFKNYIKLENSQLDLIVITKNTKNHFINLRHYHDILH